MRAAVLTDMLKYALQTVKLSRTYFVSEGQYLVNITNTLFVFNLQQHREYTYDVILRS